MQDFLVKGQIPVNHVFHGKKPQHSLASSRTVLREPTNPEMPSNSK